MTDNSIASMLNKLSNSSNGELKITYFWDMDETYTSVLYIENAKSEVIDASKYYDDIRNLCLSTRIKLDNYFHDSLELIITNSGVTVNIGLGESKLSKDDYFNEFIQSHRNTYILSKSDFNSILKELKFNQL